MSWWSLQNSLEDFTPAVPPRVPQLLVECVAEIERRGLQEVSSTPHPHLMRPHLVRTKVEHRHPDCLSVLRGVCTGFLEESVW